MRELLIKARELVDSLALKNREVEELKINLEKDKSDLSEKEINLGLKQKDLNEREGKVLGVENLLKLKEEVREGKNQLVNEREKLNNERNAFENYQAQAKGENVGLKATLEARIKEATEKEAKYNVELKILEERKKNLINEAKAEFTKQIFEISKK